MHALSNSWESLHVIKQWQDFGKVGESVVTSLGMRVLGITLNK
jgi:hypothetical protein